MKDSSFTASGKHEETRGGWHWSERSDGEFRRAVPLPEDAHVEKAQAQFKDGVLEVWIPVPESVRHKRREIPIET